MTCISPPINEAMSLFALLAVVSLCCFTPFSQNPVHIASIVLLSASYVLVGLLRLWNFKDILPGIPVTWTVLRSLFQKIRDALNWLTISFFGSGGNFTIFLLLTITGMIMTLQVQFSLRYVEPPDGAFSSDNGIVASITSATAAGAADDYRNLYNWNRHGLAFEKVSVLFTLVQIVAGAWLGFPLALSMLSCVPAAVILVAQNSNRWEGVSSCETLSGSVYLAFLLWFGLPLANVVASAALIMTSMQPSEAETLMSDIRLSTLWFRKGYGASASARYDEADHAEMMASSHGIALPNGDANASPNVADGADSTTIESNLELTTSSAGQQELLSGMPLGLATPNRHGQANASLFNDPESSTLVSCVFRVLQPNGAGEHCGFTRALATDMNGVITGVTEAMCRDLGCPVDALLDRNFASVLEWLGAWDTERILHALRFVAQGLPLELNILNLDEDTHLGHPLDRAVVCASMLDSAMESTGIAKQAVLGSDADIRAPVLLVLRLPASAPATNADEERIEAASNHVDKSNIKSRKAHKALVLMVSKIAAVGTQSAVPRPLRERLLFYEPLWLTQAGIQQPGGSVLDRCACFYFLESCGTVIAWSSGMEQLTGKKAAEVIGEPVAAKQLIVHHDDGSTVPLHSALTSGVGTAVWLEGRIPRDWLNADASRNESSSDTTTTTAVLYRVEVVAELQRRDIPTQPTPARRPFVRSSLPRMASGTRHDRVVFVMAQNGIATPRELEDQRRLFFTMSSALGELLSAEHEASPAFPEVRLENLEKFSMSVVQVVRRWAETISLASRPPRQSSEKSKSTSPQSATPLGGDAFDANVSAANANVSKCTTKAWARLVSQDVTVAGHGLIRTSHVTTAPTVPGSADNTSFTCGRSAKCTLCITDTYVSSIQFSISRRSPNTAPLATRTHRQVSRPSLSPSTLDDEVVLTDHSANGTYVNVRKIGKGKSVTLRDHDLITFRLSSGRFFLGFVFELLTDASRGRVGTSTTISKLTSTALTRAALSAAQQSLKTPPVIEWKIGEELLGKGGNAEVYLGINLTNGKLIAVKRVPLPQLVHLSPSNRGGASTADESAMAMSTKPYRALQDEIELLSKAEHPNIVRCYGSSQSETHLNILLEFVPGGSLRHLLDNFGALSDDVVVHYLAQVLQGLAYLHEHDIVHSDIKAANVLITDRGQAKLTDFGTARVAANRNGYRSAARSGQEEAVSPSDFTGDRLGGDDSRPSEDSSHHNKSGMRVVGTLLWMAPELIRGETAASPASDIWSLGCTMIEMITSGYPWSEYEFENEEQVANLLRYTKEPPEVPETKRSVLATIARACLVLDYTQRPTCADLILMLREGTSGTRSHGPDADSDDTLHATDVHLTQSRLIRTTSNSSFTGRGGMPNSTDTHSSSPPRHITLSDCSDVIAKLDRVQQLLQSS